jgi:hypothetical protein
MSCPNGVYASHRKEYFFFFVYSHLCTFVRNVSMTLHPMRFAVWCGYARILGKGRSQGILWIYMLNTGHINGLKHEPLSEE